TGLGLRRQARGAPARAAAGRGRDAFDVLPAGRGARRGGARARFADRGGGGVGRLDELDLSQSLSKKEYHERRDAAQERLTALRLALGGILPGYEGRPGAAAAAGVAGVAGVREGARVVAVVWGGGDASGKGGALKRLVEPLDPRHVRVAQYSAPTETEKRHHFLWRFWPALPGFGGMTVFDRSWYGRVLVERVEELAAKEEWERAYETIVEFERTFSAESGI